MLKMIDQRYSLVKIKINPRQVAFVYGLGKDKLDTRSYKAVNVKGGDIAESAGIFMEQGLRKPWSPALQ